MESLATTIRFVSLNCRTLSSELQQVALSRLLRYLCVAFAALQETRTRDRLVISIGNYTVYSTDADEKKIGGRAIALGDEHNNLVKNLASGHAPMETAEANNDDTFYDEVKALVSKILSQQPIKFGMDANTKMGFEQKSDVLGKLHYLMEK
ncbi:hypothetical protein RB195_002908 [Necator americanus]|uniref:Uncharacterized protein n=1 Tax=Necator americanus TaxID=51031 RepID=A0ABR1DMK4_NECAM